MKVPTLLECFALIKEATKDDELWDDIVETARMGRFMAEAGSPEGKKAVDSVYAFTGFVEGIREARRERSSEDKSTKVYS